MIGKQNLYFDNKIVGSVQISREGLFYKLHCNYKPFDEKIYILYHSGYAGHWGVCVPNTTYRVRIKDLKKGEFSLKLKPQSDHNKLYRLCEENSAFILRNLINLRIKENEEEIGLIIMQVQD